MKNIKQSNKYFHIFNKELMNFLEIKTSSLQNINKNLKNLKKTIIIKKRTINTSNNKDINKSQNLYKLNPWQVTGFIDGEGSFSVSTSGNKVKLEMKATQKENSIEILQKIQEFFDCGSVVIDNRKTKTMKYRVSSFNDILT